MPIKATFVKRLSGFQGDARLYRLDTRRSLTKYSGRRVRYQYVIASATDVPYSGPETYLFPASAKGAVTDLGELPGSQRGVVSHEDVLRDAGYEVQ